jgi:Zn-finger nucleic acid-binding protein
MPAIENVGRRKTRCPRCDVPLSPLKSAGALLTGCAKCRGVWLDRKAFANLSPSHASAKNPAAARQARLHASTSAQTLKCPICLYWMDAKNLEMAPNLVIDVCRRHGAWLDANELQAIFGSIKQRRPINTPSSTTPSLTSAAALTGASALTAPAMTDAATRNDRSVLERGADIVSEALELIDFIDIGDVGDLVSGIAEIGVGLFDGL